MYQPSISVDSKKQIEVFKNPLPLLRIVAQVVRSSGERIPLGYIRKCEKTRADLGPRTRTSVARISLDLESIEFNVHYDLASTDLITF